MPQTDPEAVQIVNQGVDLLQQGEVDGAIERLQEAIQRDPQLVEAHHFLGIACGMKGDIEAAVTHLVTALEIDNHLPKTHFNLGLLYEKQGKADLARKEMEVAVSLDPDYTQAREALALLRGSVGESIESPESAEMSRPEIPPVADHVQRHEDAKAVTHAVPTHVTCPRCGTANYATDAVCLTCGAELVGEKPHLRADHPAKPAPSSSRPPGVVQVVSGLCLLVVVLGALGLLYYGWWAIMETTVGAGRSYGSNFLDHGILMLLLLVAGSGWVFCVWLYSAISSRKVAAWNVVLVGSILGLLAMPIGTVVCGVILAFWLQHNTKAWFGVEKAA